MVTVVVLEQNTDSNPHTGGGVLIPVSVLCPVAACLSVCLSICLSVFLALFLLSSHPLFSRHWFFAAALPHPLLSSTTRGQAIFMGSGWTVSRCDKT